MSSIVSLGVTAVRRVRTGGTLRLEGQIYGEIKLTPMHNEFGGSLRSGWKELSPTDPLISSASSVGTGCVVGGTEVISQAETRLGSSVHLELKLSTKPCSLLSREMLRALVVIRHHLPDHGLDVWERCDPVGHADTRVVHFDPQDLDTTTKREGLVRIVNRDHSQKPSWRIVHESHLTTGKNASHFRLRLGVIVRRCPWIVPPTRQTGARSGRECWATH